MRAQRKAAVSFRQLHSDVLAKAALHLQTELTELSIIHRRDPWLMEFHFTLDKHRARKLPVTDSHGSERSADGLVAWELEHARAGGQCDVKFLFVYPGRIEHQILGTAGVRSQHSGVAARNPTGAKRNHMLAD